jgi:tetratricopeptide (TPR) repeat protein
VGKRRHVDGNKSDATTGPRKSSPPKISRADAEKTLRDIHELLEAQNFDNAEEMNAYLEKLRGSGLETAVALRGDKSAKRLAQDLAYEAMDAEYADDAVSLARKALQFDPDCVDALCILADETASSDEQANQLYSEAVAAGERSLGEEFFRENRGHFWGIVQTRPYMRALLGLAQLLMEAGRSAEGIARFERLLDLNPHDNQGARNELLAAYLLVGDLGGAGRVLDNYERDSSAVFAWGRVLYALLRGDYEAAERSLAVAREQNKHAERYLNGKRKLPEVPPEVYSFGSENEGIVCAEILGEAWKSHSRAMEWLRQSSRRRT